MQLLDRAFDVSTQCLSAAELTPDAVRSVEQFLFHEARLLDERRFKEWLGLWAAEGRYWVPRFHSQANPFEQVSLFWENRLLREVRVKRLENARNWSQQPATRSARIVGNVTVDGLDGQGHVVVRSSIQLTEWRVHQRQLAGSVFHKLAATESGGWEIVLKRVDLVNCESVFEPLEVFI